MMDVCLIKAAAVLIRRAKATGLHAHLRVSVHVDPVNFRYLHIYRADHGHDEVHQPVMRPRKGSKCA